MLVVVTLISLMAAVSYPSIRSGVDSLRLEQATDEVVALFNRALTQTERHRMAVEVIVSPPENSIAMIGQDPRVQKWVAIPPGVAILGVLPAGPMDPRAPRRFLLSPGGATPRVGLVLGNSRGSRRVVWIDPVAGVPVIRRLEPGEPL